MKLHGQTIVMIPWWDADNMKQWIRLTFHGNMDRRFMYRQVVKYVKTEFNKVVNKNWVKINCNVVNEHRVKMEPTDNKELFNKNLEEFIKRMESYEDEDESNSVLQNEDSRIPAEPLSDLLDKN